MRARALSTRAPLALLPTPNTKTPLPTPNTTWLDFWTHLRQVLLQGRLLHHPWHCIWHKVRPIRVAAQANACIAFGTKCQRS